MKDSGAPSVGDMVRHKHDKQNDIFCAGLVVAERGTECKVHWCLPPSLPYATGGWYRRHLLEVISESG